MEKRNVITNLPIRLPINSTILYSFLLYYFNVSGLNLGMFITAWTIVWILAIILKFTEVRVDVFKDTKKTFKERLVELKTKQNGTK